MADPFLIYGAAGYTGALVARLAAERGEKPILAARTEGTLGPLAAQLGLEHRVFGLADPQALDRGLTGVRAVLHCAGPFSGTSRPMVEACLRTRTHYLDITGEAPVFEALHARDSQAKAAGVMLLPGAGFDVVPSDCLAAHLKRRMPEARRLRLAFQLLGGVSHGTAATMLENIGKGGLVRRGGVLTPVPAAWKTRAIDFGRGPRQAISIPWGDVSTAFYSTGIPDIEVYMAAPFAVRAGVWATRLLGPLLATPAAQRLLRRRLRARPPGPTDEERARGRGLLFGEVKDGSGRAVASRLRTPEGYTLTALTSLIIVSKVLAGQAPPGFQTPSTAYGPDLILEVEGVTREDLPAEPA
jgi:short subunit dehydrogenase-like uncharacterized protein